MDKLKVRFWIDLTAFVTLLVTAVSGLVLLVFKHLSGPWREMRFLGLNPKIWVHIHDLFGVATIIFIAIHIGMHMDWIRCAFKKMRGKQKSPPKKRSRP